MGLPHGNGNQNEIVFIKAGNRHKYKIIMFETMRDLELFHLDE